MSTHGRANRVRGGRSRKQHRPTESRLNPRCSSGPRPNSVVASQLRVQEFALRMFEALDTPRSHSLHIMASAGMWESVVRSAPDPKQHTGPNEFFLDYQCCKLMSKNPLLPTGINTRAVAEKKFIEAEKACLLTNERLRDLSTGVSPRLHRILHAAQRKIADILGDRPELEELDLSFGPGANFGVRGNTSAYHKLTSPMESTHSMIELLPELLGEAPGWFGPDGTIVEVSLVNGSDLTFVPKDATTDRAICIEPLLNGFLQKGIGVFIRNRLRRHGVNLKDQTINQDLARIALDSGLSTVDFSSASDTIAYNLVWELLPPEWCELLDAARCPNFRYDGRWYPFQKFSSMGNAYTFELETLIFYALAYACCVEVEVQPRTGVNLHVYGDDVIIPRVAFDLFQEVSTFCGFTLNSTKSFRDGVFFESCGTDVFLGRLVTPFRLKRGLATVSDLFFAANLVVRIIERIHDNTTENNRAANKARVDRLSDVHRWLVGLIPSHRMVLGPYDEGDDWLICAFDRVCPSQGTFGWRHRKLVVTPVKYMPNIDPGNKYPEWPMSYALYGAYRSSGERNWDELAPVLWSEGAALRNVTRTRVGVTWSSDWRYPLALVAAGRLWQGY